ncbi:ABC transporter substrate-binding protein [Phytoactinopolyspora halotolerans]|uniref:ABC transporter substrate-binding protein n=1 Tax=Phytoactinopolyspora halotolerans TaxID=1981512 RepID=A0A6L9SAI6_9ACTN|nr:ABC transporter substrate-binding protein [Phytoactinopolyspora halotolerans]NEE00990.1 ABC transporter substrate-binding protein [Phytoactinopolyspora halotolerans]
MQSTTRRRSRVRITLLAAAAASTIAACGGAGAASTDGESAEGFPVTVENCGIDVTFDEPPSRVILLESAPVTILEGLGVLDSVVLRAGAFPPAYYDAETNAAIEKIPSMGDELDDKGHLQISLETIIDAEPDLVFGLPDGMSRDGLTDAGIQVLEQPTFCADAEGATTFENIYEQVETYGRIFDRTDEADAFVDELNGRVEDVRATAEKQGGGRTAAVLYPTVGGGSGYAYGNKSMAHPQLEAAGFENVFDDVDERVFEVTLEQLISRDPDVLVLLHVDGEPGPVKDAVVNLPGAESLTAVANDDILVQLFNFTEPPTPVSIDGLERIAEHFGGGG